MPETMAMINGLGHDLQILQIYGGSSIKNPEMTEDLINIFVDVILFWTQLLHFLRRNFKGAKPFSLNIKSLCSLLIPKNQLSCIVGQISRKISRMQVKRSEPEQRK